ncbi:hypothetical protein B5S28_g5086 [[Candida] boidinii]|uniref:Unnamed protein product n=1 Tax=Candida boidinii TaxID=5477 RepID=A0ACB5TFZ8_CANBO|nr:hypothetical protein B5S28_g5086 [[Candida] boidinii]OWB61838.1 hypothetical protein B5S29_g2742 [[Candida] boidinii]OWB75514.1 hypothetical protein B5S31_g5423 [[Candida] boidinii]OWB78621.1 hypothetical protein B5S32_g2819 [[Candida] boidinii]GME71687.1 unnamed protein product [[Candida] boidinii]
MVHQDLPPVGGYEKIQWKRHLPSRGFRPSIWFAGLVGLTGYGFYKIIEGNREITELSREKLWARIHLLPLLQAEQDRDIVRRTLSYYEKEAEIMKDVPWWEVKSPYSDKGAFHPPHTVLTGKQLDKDGLFWNANSKDRFPEEKK